MARADGGNFGGIILPDNVVEFAEPTLRAQFDKTVQFLRGEQRADYFTLKVYDNYPAGVVSRDTRLLWCE